MGLTAAVLAEIWISFWGRLIGPDVYHSMMSEVADLMAALSASSGATSAAKQSHSRADVTYAAPVPPIVPPCVPSVRRNNRVRKQRHR